MGNRVFVAMVAVFSVAAGFAVAITTGAGNAAALAQTPDLPPIFKVGIKVAQGMGEPCEIIEIRGAWIKCGEGWRYPAAGNNPWKAVP